MLEISILNELSFYNDKGVLVIPAKQYDTARKFQFVITDIYSEIDLSDCSVYIRVLKSDGKQFQSSDCCLVSENVVTIDTSLSNGDQLLTSPGENIGELHFTDSEGKELTTWSFIIMIKERVHDGSTIDRDSLNSWDKLDEIANNNNKTNARMDKLETRFNNHEIYALEEPTEHEQLLNDYWYLKY